MTTANLPTQPAEDEIDLRQLAAALQRHWQLIAKVAGGALVLSAIYAFTQPRVWEGEFQIVLARDNPPSSGAQALLQSNPGLASLIGGAGGENELETEVKILESPSVLKPVFDFVKSRKGELGENTSRWTYSNWIKNSLSIDLEKGTSVLNLTYRDTEKSLILPTISKISKAYQGYSGRDRERGISQGIRYLDEQIAVHRKESVNSLRAAQQYAIEQDLTALKGEGQEDEIVNAINIEAIRVSAANEIRNIDEQLKQLRALGNDPEALMYLGRNIPELAAQGLPQTLDAIDTQLATLRAKFTDKENSIRQLKARRRVLIETFKRQTYGYLYARRTSAQARLAAAERPKGVLIRYRELLREAARDEATLNRLESERQVLALEQARKQDPWELISNPTLLDNPVAPRKGIIMALGLLAGLVAGSGAALVVDRRSGRVFAEDEVASALPYPLLAKVDPQTASFDNLVQLLASGPLASAGAGTVALIPVGEISANTLEPLRLALEQRTGQNVLCSTDLVYTQRCSTQLLVAHPGSATREQLSLLRQNLKLQGTPVAGWILFRDAA